MRDIVMPASTQRLPDDPQTTPRWRWHEPVHYSFPRGWGKVARAQLTLQAHALLFGLLAHLGWDNQVTDSLAIVGRAIGMHRNTVTRSLRRLERARLVCVDRSNPRLLRITVSPFLVWQGRPHQMYKARKAFDERCRLSARDRQAAQQHEEDTASLAAVAALP